MRKGLLKTMIILLAVFAFSKCEQNEDKLTEIALEKNSYYPCEEIGDVEVDWTEVSWKSHPTNGSWLIYPNTYDWVLEYEDSQGEAICVEDGWSVRWRVLINSGPSCTGNTTVRPSFIYMNGIKVYFGSINNTVAELTTPITKWNLTGNPELKVSIKVPYVGHTGCQCYITVAHIIDPQGTAWAPVPTTYWQGRSTVLSPFCGPGGN